jgi:hypothetical protein
MRLTHYLVFTALATGCSSTSIPSETADSGHCGVGDAGCPVSCARGSIWKPTSARISLRSFGFFNGSSGYERDRSDLTAEQKSALEGLCVVPSPTQFATDGVIYTLEIADQDGSRALYYAAQGDAFDRDYGPTLAFANLAPFLTTFSCLAASQTRPMTSEEPSPPWRDAPDVSVDPACRNGIFMPYKCHQVWVRLNVPSAATHRLELERCFGSMALKVFTNDGMTEIAASDPVSGTACPALSHAFEAGSWLLRVDKTNGDDSCDATTSAGDFFLRVDGAPPQAFK